MGRPKKQKLTFTEESAEALLQEIYDDTFLIRAQIKRLFHKWEVKVQEGGEIAAIGDQIIKLISASSKNLDQKIMLLKFLKEVVYERNKNTNNDSDETIEAIGESERRSALVSLIEKKQQEAEDKKKEQEKKEKGEE